MTVENGQAPKTRLLNLDSCAVHSCTGFFFCGQVTVIFLISRLLNIFSHVVENTTPGAHSFKVLQ